MVFCAAVVVMVKTAKKATSLRVKNITVVAIWVLVTVVMMVVIVRG